MSKFVELLAPAGSYEAFLGALNAGADAVYLGGDRFGARAYAENLDTEQICRALHIAHFYGRKIYLTVNTLLKERELSGLYEYLAPFYEAGLDGVIVQDLGVFRYIKEHFPNLPLHGSTQMTVTGRRGAAFLQEHGAVRIVPARELSLEEVRQIKDQTGMAVECFIHGAMCYCYSGQCLFSSMLGGRSGNRGRCAQPCRLPYEIYDGKKRISGEGYPLSLKDMCTLEYLPALIDAGIDSFKIEGRMKRPEYAAGVTAIYRKYIDLYYQKGTAGYRVDPADMDRLRGLYIRSEIQTGYYERHNGREMITLEKPGYQGSDEAVLAQVRADYLHEPEKMPVRMQAMVRVGEPLRLRMCLEQREQAPLSGEAAADRKKRIEALVEIAGETVQPARNAPLTEADIRKQLCKMGESLLTVTDCEICLEGDGFVPVRALNLLRREAVERLEQAVITAQRGNDPTEDIHKGNGENRPNESTKDARISMPVSPLGSQEDASGTHRTARPDIDCLVTTYEQLEAVAEADCRRIYLESDLLLAESDRIAAILERQGQGRYYLALPYILRERDERYLERLEMLLRENGKQFSGVLVRNLESLSYVWALAEKEAGTSLTDRIIADAGLYCFNGEAAAFLRTSCQEITLPYELNAGEASHLTKAARRLGLQVNQIAYSRIPMMITANCLQKTADFCLAGQEKGRMLSLKDRQGVLFPVVLNCEHCYNVIYNAVPYSLHTAKKERERIGASALRYDFVLENGSQCQQILKGEYPFTDYTTGHCKRGVE
ncbi:MAG: U32 family peptidase [Lachnospiraceae bacterium]|nr:U32 family peptidase [Lachnospiraceae bacterium]